MDIFSLLFSKNTNNKEKISIYLIYIYIYIYIKGVENADKYEISASRGVHCQTSVVFLSFLSIICPSLALSLFF